MRRGVPSPNIDAAVGIEIEQPIAIKRLLNLSSQQRDGVGFRGVFDCLNLFERLASRGLHLRRFAFQRGRRGQKRHGVRRTEQGEHIDHFHFQRRIFRLQRGKQRPQRLGAQCHKKLLDSRTKRPAVGIGQRREQGRHGIVVRGENSADGFALDAARRIAQPIDFCFQLIRIAKPLCRRR